MPASELPSNELVRLEVLRALDQLDTGPEERFDRILEMAKLIFAVPIALVSLVDEDRQWFKSKVGLGVQCTDRSASFCSHAILKSELLIVEDALADERFNDNPLVNGPPYIRSYAGAPIAITDEFRIGTVCIIDTEPRVFDEKDKMLLIRFAELVRDELLRPSAPSSQQLMTGAFGSMAHACHEKLHAIFQKYA